jgi:N-acetylglucosaminyldiphosphoundecaprenol N-acetyl-beta-D-mannosaminyltransferase
MEIQNKIKFFNINLDLISKDEFVKSVIEKAKEKDHAYACFVNVHMVIESYLNSNLRYAINNSNWSVIDGMPVKFALNVLFNKRTERLAGMDLLEYILAAAEKENLNILFYGTTTKKLQNIREKINLQFPKLRIAGLISPPFERYSDNKSDVHVEYAKRLNADIIFVSLGCPKQELWMAGNFEKFNGVLLGVGGAFDVYSGEKKRAPVWMQNSGLEWLFRLVLEPKRLFVRYFITNTFFIFLFIKELIRFKILKRDHIIEQDSLMNKPHHK